MQKYDISECYVYTALGVPRSTVRRLPQKTDDEEAFTKDILHLIHQCGRYGYRRLTALFHIEGWKVNHKHVERIWREQGLKAAKKQPKRKRLYLNDGSGIRLRPLYPNYVW